MNGFPIAIGFLQKKVTQSAGKHGFKIDDADRLVCQIVGVKAGKSTKGRGFVRVRIKREPEETKNLYEHLLAPQPMVVIDENIDYNDQYEHPIGHETGASNIHPEAQELTAEDTKWHEVEDNAPDPESGLDVSGLQSNTFDENEYNLLRKQKIEIETKLCIEQLRIAERQRYKLDLELLKMEQELELPPSKFTQGYFSNETYESTYDNCGLETSGATRV